jgi:hypothetical protein
MSGIDSTPRGSEVSKNTGRNNNNNNHYEHFLFFLNNELKSILKVRKLYTSFYTMKSQVLELRNESSIS